MRIGAGGDSLLILTIGSSSLDTLFMEGLRFDGPYYCFGVGKISKMVSVKLFCKKVEYIEGTK